jgi:pimeloyl-ACP methyl ester carboxylesterase
MTRIESLLSARLFLVPQVVGERIFFMSNLSGRLSIYVMDRGGSVPEPLLPPNIALQNPHLMNGYSFIVYPDLGKILVMIDENGNEIYRPMFVPIDGGFPEPVFPDQFAGEPVHAIRSDLERNLVYLLVESKTEALHSSYRAGLATGTLTKLAEGKYGAFPVGTNEGHTKTILIDAYGIGDHVLYLLEEGSEKEVLFGTPIEERAEGEDVPRNSISNCNFVARDEEILFTTSLFDDAYGLGAMKLRGTPEPVTVEGMKHGGLGELVQLEHVADDRYLVGYNIDGCSWLYEGAYDPAARRMTLTATLCGRGELASGVLESCRHDSEEDRFALSFSTATSPTQIYTIEGRERDRIERHTNERVLGIPVDALSSGEDASFTTYDGLRVSARLYLPAASLGYTGARPVVYYLHGGPQSQERPDFAWFSMPLIQFLTMRGFAVFVPNARGSSGYGFEYMRKVERDWGGDDRLDHVHAMTEVLPKDSRLDVSRTGVVGRSYGGYMTLTLASRHPELWSAAVDMFGPYDLIGFSQRIPETWKPFMDLMVGNPETDREFLIERSPRTYIHDLTCPLLVIQGKNDPRVLEVESREVVEKLRDAGRDVDYLMFEDEGHDILKFENRIRCYNAITEFFVRHLAP